MKNEMYNFCMVVKNLRSKHNLSKTAMSKILGISVSSLNKLEDGVMPRISSMVVFRMMGYFHIRVEDVFGEDLAGDS